MTGEATGQIGHYEHDYTARFRWIANMLLIGRESDVYPGNAATHEALMLSLIHI